MTSPRRTQPKAFDITRAIDLLCRDLCERLPVFQHIEMDQVVITFSQARTRSLYGIQAKLTPMRFEQGALITKRRGKEWTVPRFYRGKIEILYLLSVYLPRFQDQCFREKLITIVHELYHISPHFDGDIRRFGGRYHAHSGSQKKYDELMARYVDDYLGLKPSEHLLAFLQPNFDELIRSQGQVIGTQIEIPKLIPVNKAG